MIAWIAMNHSVRTPAYDTYTKLTCNLCITSKPALTVYQMPTQLCSLSPRSQFRIRTQLFLRLFLMRFFLYVLSSLTFSSFPLLPPPKNSKYLFCLSLCPKLFFSYFFCRFPLWLFGWHLSQIKLMCLVCTEKDAELRHKLLGSANAQ